MFHGLRLYMYYSTNPSALLLIAIAASICSASPLLRPTTLQSISHRQSSSQCTFTGNSDLYGLGIRIGIYLQWISGLLANSFYADSVQDMLATNTIFLIALFTALAIISANDTVLAAEVTILLQFCFGFLFTASSNWGLRVSAKQLNSAKEYKKRVDFPLLGSAIRLCLATAICAYNVWFWFVGIRKLSEETCDPVGFLFAPVDLLRRARVFFKLTSVMILAFFSIATLSELLLLISNWVFYSFIAGFIAALITFHQDLQSDGAQKRNRVDGGAMENTEAASNASKTEVHNRPKKALATLLVLMDYFPVVIGGIPWIMMNADTGVGFKRPQSWVLIIIAGAFIILCLLILFAVGVAAIRSCGSILLDFCLEHLHRLWVLCKEIRSAIAIPWLRQEDVATQPSLQLDPIFTPSIAQHSELKRGKEVVEGHSESMEKVVAVDAAQADLSAEISSGESPRHSEHIVATRPPIHAKEKLDGNRLDLIEPIHSVAPAETAPNDEQPRKGPNKARRPSHLVAAFDETAPNDEQPQKGPNKGRGFSQLVLEFWNKLGDYEDNSAQIPSWIRWALTSLPFINLVCVVWSILSIELTIKWNNIVEVYTIQSVGQLIPLVIGIVGFLKLLLDISVQRTQLWIYQVVLDSLMQFSHTSDESNSADTNTATVDSHNVSQPVFPEPVPVVAKIPVVLRAIFSIKIKDEVKLAKSEPMIQISIGDQIISLLDRSANASTDPVEKANLLKAKRICDDFRTTQRGLVNSNDEQRKRRRNILEELHHVDINLHVLAIEWFGRYTNDWWLYIRRRWRMIVVAKSKSSFKIKVDNGGNIDSSENFDSNTK